MSLGQFLFEDMQKHPIGVKGTPSEVPIETLGDWLIKELEEGKPEVKGTLPSWAKWPVGILTAGVATLGDWLTRKKRGGKPLFTKEAQAGQEPYEVKAKRLMISLKDHNYSAEDRQHILKILAGAYGREPLNESDLGL